MMKHLRFTIYDLRAVLMMVGAGFFLSAQASADWQGKATKQTKAAKTAAEKKVKPQGPDAWTEQTAARLKALLQGSPEPLPNVVKPEEAKPVVSKNIPITGAKSEPVKPKEAPKPVKSDKAKSAVNSKPVKETSKPAMAKPEPVKPSKPMVEKSVKKSAPVKAAESSEPLDQMEARLKSLLTESPKTAESAVKVEKPQEAKVKEHVSSTKTVKEIAKPAKPVAKPKLIESKSETSRTVSTWPGKAAPRTTMIKPVKTASVKPVEKSKPVISETVAVKPSVQKTKPKPEPAKSAETSKPPMVDSAAATTAHGAWAGKETLSPKMFKPEVAKTAEPPKSQNITPAPPIESTKMKVKAEPVKPVDAPKTVMAKDAATPATSPKWQGKTTLNATMFKPKTVKVEEAPKSVRSGEAGSAAPVTWSGKRTLRTTTEQPETDQPAKPIKMAKAVITPNFRPSGKITMVNMEGRFVVLSYPLGAIPEVNHRLSVYRDGLKVGEIKVSGPQRDISTVADIVAGSVQLQDDVREE